MSVSRLLPKGLSATLPESGFPLMSNAAWKILEQIYQTWSTIWIRKDPIKAKIWYSQVGQEERWIPLNGTQARVARAAIGHGFLNFVKMEQAEDGEWSVFRITGEGNRAFQSEQLRREEHRQRQENWTAHLLVCGGCRSLLDEQSRLDTMTMIESVRFLRLTPVIPDQGKPCSSDTPGAYYLSLTDWRR